MFIISDFEKRYQLNWAERVYFAFLWPVQQNSTQLVSQYNTDHSLPVLDAQFQRAKVNISDRSVISRIFVKVNSFLQFLLLPEIFSFICFQRALHQHPMVIGSYL